MILTFTLIGGGLGSIIPWFVDGLTFDGEALSGIIYSTGYFGHEISYLLAGLITDLPDKIVSVALALVILYLIPKRFYPDFAFTSWKQAPLSAEEIASAGKTKMRRMSLQKKILFIFGASLIIVSLTEIIIGVSLYRSDIIKDHTQLAQGNEIEHEWFDYDKFDSYDDYNEDDDRGTVYHEPMYEHDRMLTSFSPGDPLDEMDDPDMIDEMLKLNAELKDFIYHYITLFEDLLRVKRVYEPFLEKIHSREEFLTNEEIAEMLDEFNSEANKKLNNYDKLVPSGDYDAYLQSP